MSWYPLEKLSVSNESEESKGAVFFVFQDVGDLGVILEEFQQTLDKIVALNDQQRMEILVIVDELLSNSLIASYTKSPENRKEQLFGTWHMTENDFNFTVIDFGKGLFKKVLMDRVYSSTEKEVIDAYQKANVVKLVRNGKPYSHTCTGRGLAMVKGLATDFSIDLVSQNWEVFQENTINDKQSVMGSKFSVVYNIL